MRRAAKAEALKLTLKLALKLAQRNQRTAFISSLLLLLKNDGEIGVNVGKIGNLAPAVLID